MNMNHLIMVNNQVDRAIEIMREVSEWGRNQGFCVWLDEWLTKEQLLCEDNCEEDFYVGKVDGVDACCMIIQWQDREYWPEAPRYEAAYIHKLCVRRDYAGQGILKDVLIWLKQECKKRNVRYIRLDTGWDKEKVKNIYLGLGFRIVKKLDYDNNRSMALYELRADDAN
jgi:GNAT superfamily N-acetyltransferase